MNKINDLSVSDFEIRTGKMHWDDLQVRNVEADCMVGRFWGYRRLELLEICKLHPDLHIISHVGKTRFNYYIPEASAYFLGDGESDPSLKATYTFPTREEIIAGLTELLSIPESERTEEHHFGIMLLSAGAGGADLSNARVMAQLIDKK